MIQRVPCILYKFRQINEYTENILRTGKFYFQDWENMNDPMEGFYNYIPDTENETNNIALEQSIRAEKKKYKICSFSKKNTNVLLWAHYANNFKGICIEVMTNKELYNDNLIPRAINYKKYISSFVHNQNIQINALNILSHKIKKWKYEKEFRFFSTGNNNNDDNDNIEVGFITAVYLGSRIREEDKEKIKSLVANKNIKVIETEICFDTNKVIAKRENINE
jgi:hypothetical protein